MEEVNKSTRELGEVFLKPKSEDEITQTPAIENIPGTQSLRDTLSFKNRCINFFKQEENETVMYIGILYTLNYFVKNEFKLKKKIMIKLQSINKILLKQNFLLNF